MGYSGFKLLQIKEISSRGRIFEAMETFAA